MFTVNNQTFHKINLFALQSIPECRATVNILPKKIGISTFRLSGKILFCGRIFTVVVVVWTEELSLPCYSLRGRRARGR